MLRPRTILSLALALTCTHVYFPGASAQTVQRGSLRQEMPALEQPLPGARMSSAFGLRKHPVLGVTMMHEGVDFAAPAGAPIKAAAAGVVSAAGGEKGYGSVERRRNGEGQETVYGHMGRIAVGSGETITAGELIGYVGRTGLATGPHLHFEVRRNGAAVNAVAIDREPAPVRLTGAARLVQVVRGGRTNGAAGGPTRAAGGSVEVVRGRR